MTTFAVIAYASHYGTGTAGGLMPRVLDSYRRIGRCEPFVAGLGRHPFSFRDKINTLYEVARSGLCDVLISVDAWDTCCVRPIFELVNAFNADPNSRAMVIGAETNCFPRNDWRETFPDVESRYRYLNGGLWIASASWFVMQCERHGWHDLPSNKMDQESFAETYLRSLFPAVVSPQPFVLDTGVNYFHNLYGADGGGSGTAVDWELRDGVYTVKSTNTRPFISHGNGQSNITAVLDAMGIPAQP